MSTSTRVTRRSARGLLGAALVLALGIAPGTAGAQSVCDQTPVPSTDLDDDGFPSSVECAGLELIGPLVDGTTQLPRCTGVAGEECMDAETPDLFMILVPASPSLLPSEEPMRHIAAPEAEGGLGLFLHFLDPAAAPADRIVSPAGGQKALRITENLDPNGNVMGISQHEPSDGPNGIDQATIFSQRIIDFVTETCAGKQCCTALDGCFSDPEDVARIMMRNTLAHESGHVFGVRSEYDSKHGGNHYRSGSGSVMEQFISYTDRKGKVTLSISEEFTSADQGDRNLH